MGAWDLFCATARGLVLVIALPVASVVHADDSTPENDAALDFLFGCLLTAPSFDGATEQFANWGYNDKTLDPLIFSRENQAFFAGLGIVDFEGSPKLTTPNGCLVYVRNGDGRKTAQALQEHIDLLIPGSQPEKHQNDYYWFVAVDDQNPITIFVSPKTNGFYAGYTLLMVNRGHLPDPAT